MADMMSSELSEEKEPDGRRRRHTRPWDDSYKSAEMPLTPGNPETLGFYDVSHVGDLTSDQQEHSPDPSLSRFICTELTSGYFLEHNEAKYTEQRERVYTCMRIPKELEKLMLFGFFLCMDAFLYAFTLLPLRVLLATLRLLTLPCCGFSGSRLLQPAQVCDMLKGLILLLCYYMMHYVDYAMMYHLIRGQSVIKLYLIYNMLEVADRLFSSIGQDVLDALYWTATEPKARKRDNIGVIPHFIMALFYVFLHAILIMVQASTLNVAFNSHNKSLLTIMMSNNFVEIKGNVFKKFGKSNLFQMSNSDIKERFTSYILLLIVVLRNMEQMAWNMGHLWKLIPTVVMVVISEVAVDIIKHAFITKFNNIRAEVYSEYRASLAFDLLSSRQKNAYTDYSDSVARRMGFIPLPSAVLLIRVVMTSVKVQGALAYTCVFLLYLGLLTLKVLNSIVLLGKSCVLIKRANMEDKLYEQPAASESTATTEATQNDTEPAPCSTPTAESVEEQLPATPPKPPIPISCQPTPRTDLFPPPLIEVHVPAVAATSAITITATIPDNRPSTPPPEPEQPIPSLSKEEEGEPGADSELRQRTSKKELLEIDRFTICGSRID
ncbi:transmembrane anterior posterior transformation protein 1 homolog [Boleophthalmus pectinirostris]|uniref:transmembrane anterior posterior transformation protein 1 homolog n=1 Tax=Boleophthalmus pectinirostris TaxID=150288 RepID=UPI00242C4981|nr:transmembrane anterior posterior transformation protein 1 homolog [Boleophthalmus pectinirostris]